MARDLDKFADQLRGVQPSIVAQVRSLPAVPKQKGSK